MGDDDGDEGGSIAEIVFHFGEENLKDRTPHQWAIENKGHNDKKHIGNHWFGRKSSVRRPSFHNSAINRKTLAGSWLDHLRMAPRATMHQNSDQLNNIKNLNHNAFHDHFKTKFNEKDEFAMPRNSRKQSFINRSSKMGGGFLDSRRGSTILN